MLKPSPKMTSRSPVSVVVHVSPVCEAVTSAPNVSAADENQALITRWAELNAAAAQRAKGSK